MMKTLSPSQIAPVNAKGILIQLTPYPKDLPNENGLYTPKYSAYETDGGRPAAKIDSQIYSLHGTILHISPAAQQELDKLSIKLSPNDQVVVSPAAKNHRIYLNPLQEVSDFEGYILVHPQHIEYKINDPTN